MGELVNSFTRLLTDFLEQNEKRHNEQRSVQDANAKHIEELKAKVEKLEISNQQLQDHNKNVDEELASVKQREEDKVKELAALRTELDAQKTCLEEYGKWNSLITALVSQVSSIQNTTDLMSEDLKHHHEVLNKLSTRVRQCQQQCTYIPSRVPVKSATTSSFQNGNIHNSMPRVQTPVYQRNNSFLGSFDAEEELSEMNDHAALLKEGVAKLNDLQRSFERSSFYSDD